MRDARLKKLAQVKPFIAGTIVEYGRVCGREGCKCARGEKHKAQHLTYKDKNQKTVSVYIPVDKLQEVKEWAEEVERTHPGDQRTAEANPEEARDREAPQEGKALMLAFHKTLRRFFPKCKKLDSLGDPRDPAKITYALPTLFFTGVLLFLFKLGSRCQIDFFFNSAAFIRQLEILGGQRLGRAPDNDTLAYLCERISPEQLDGVRVHMIRSLVRSQALEYGRLMARYWLIAIDGTGRITYGRPHCPHCLTMTRGGKTVWYHNTLEAKLVTPDGFALSVQTEFIENEGGAARGKQDCELKAFRRMAPRLKRDFPQLPICIIADSLYSCGPVFDIAKENRWHFIITFKEGSIPTLFAESNALKPRCRDNTARREDNGVVQSFSWVNDLEYGQTPPDRARMRRGEEENGRQDPLCLDHGHGGEPTELQERRERREVEMGN